MSVTIAVLILHFYLNKNFDEMLQSLSNTSKEPKQTNQASPPSEATESLSQVSQYVKNPDGKEYAC